MIVAQVSAQLAGEAGRVTGAGGHYPARPGTGHTDGHVGLCVQNVDLADRNGAVVTGQAQFGTAARGCRDVIGIDRVRRVGGVGRARGLPIP